LGTTYTLTYQPDEQTQLMELMLEPTTLAFLAWDYPHGDMKIRTPCKVEHTKYNYSQDFGTSVEIGLREIDENLNPYGHLTTLV